MIILSHKTSNYCNLVKRGVRLFITRFWYFVPAIPYFASKTSFFLAYFSASSLSCDGDLPMVSSVKELHEKYKVQALVDEEVSISRLLHEAVCKSVQTYVAPMISLCHFRLIREWVRDENNIAGDEEVIGR